MNESDIKPIIKKYSIRINLTMLGFSLLMIFLNAYFTERAIQRSLELELNQDALTYTTEDWGPICIAGFVVLNLIVYFVERVLTEVFKRVGWVDKPEVSPN